MACGIYGIHNLVNDKWYVGQAVNIRARWNVHRSLLTRNERESVHLLRAWNKYGSDAFEWVVLEECTPEQLNEREIAWIAQKDSYKNGYNRTLGGGGIRGYHLSESHRARLREATREKWADPEHRKKRLQAMHAVTESDDYRAKISEAGKKNWSDPEFKNQSLKRMQEGARNPAAIQKRRESLKIALQNPETRAKLSKASKQNWKTESYREKVNSARARAMDDTYRKRASMQSKERWKSGIYRNLVRTNLSKAKRAAAPEVLQIETGRVYNSIADASEVLGISYAHILSVCYGKRRSAGGFHWRFFKESQEEWESRRDAFILEAGIAAYPKVICVETGEVFEQPKCAAEKVGVHPSNITKVCRGEQLSAGGFHWRYLNESEELREARENLQEKSAHRIPNEHSRVRIQCVETGKVFGSVSSAAKSLNINRSGISNALRGKSKTAGGFHWEYESTDRSARYGSRKIVCIETGTVYHSLQEASNLMNINRSSISNALRGKSKAAGGFHWKYFDKAPEKTV